MLKEWLAAETDPAVRQELLYTLDDKPALLKAVEQDGAFGGTTFWSNWRWMKETVHQYPDSYIARGIKAYEAVQGLPYFGIDRQEAGIPMWEHGSRWFDCRREIPGWEEYLKAYSNHDGAGDAAYRLGRCYEIARQYDRALKTFRLTMELPNGEMAPHARLRIAWLLDVLMTDEQLISLRLDDPGLTTAAAYTLAVRDLRAGRYAKAVEHFDAVLAHADQGDLLPRLRTEEYTPFWAGARKQRDQAAKLRDLAAQATPAADYEIAATMYHNDLLFYNYLWSGGKLTYLAYDEGDALQGDMEPAVFLWAAGSNNYIQAAGAFAPLERTPGAVGDKAAFSRAMALIMAVQSPTPDLPLLRPREEITAEAQTLLERFVAERPKSNLVPDALQSLGDRLGQALLGHTGQPQHDPRGQHLCTGHHRQARPCRPNECEPGLGRSRNSGGRLVAP